MDPNQNLENQQEEAKLKEELANREPQGEEIRLQPPVTCGQTEHFFSLSRIEGVGLVARCDKCTVAYPVGIGHEVKGGHIYIHGTLVI